ncbi:MAG TPA: DUF6265 family protein [Candidatus Acidoferrum sp.]|nr:DUF6265 family protein [Candidatus Acidoferrum sp.]
MNGLTGQKRTVALASATFVLFLPCARGQKPSAAVASPSQTASQAPAGTPMALSDLAWLEGRWQGDWGPRIAEQVWTAPKSGLMLGTFRLTEDDKTLVIELFTLVQKPNGVELRFRHFTPDLSAWEKDDATVLTLESSDSKRSAFMNPLNGQPKHVFFTRIDPDTYVSRSEIVGDSGDMQVIEITYHRQKPSAANGENGARR